MLYNKMLESINQYVNFKCYILIILKLIQYHIIIVLSNVIK